MISQVVIDKVLSKAQETASHSWEYGTVFEALLEYRDPRYSIFHDPFPGGKIPELTVEDVEALRYVKPFIQTNSTRLCDGNGKPSDIGREEGILTIATRFVVRSNISLHSRLVGLQINNLPSV